MVGFFLYIINKAMSFIRDFEFVFNEKKDVDIKIYWV